MDFEEYKNSLKEALPPVTISPHLTALWYDGKGDWRQAHMIIQDIQDSSAAEIHAYLHRKEGDQWNVP